MVVKIPFNGVTGITDPVTKGNETPVRLPIDLLAKDKDMWTLYLLGSHHMKNTAETSQSDPMSWFQIGGIHGLPYVKWDGKSAPTQVSAGYCAHEEIIFPTWHRPYLALFEQALYGYMKFAVNALDAKHPKKKDYLTILPSFRIPYWDFASYGYPEQYLRNEDVKLPSGADYMTVRNPLYSYKFVQSADIGDKYWVQFENTFRNVPGPVRGEADNRPSNPRSDDRSLVQAFDGRYTKRDDLRSREGLRANLTDTIRLLLLNVKDYQWMSNNAAPDNMRADKVDKNRFPVQAYQSLEGPHNSVHGTVGNGGQMGDTGTSAFDPVFWMHHCNIDRICTLWQYLNPNEKYASSQTAAHNSPSYTGGRTKLTLDSPLTPFRTAQNVDFDSRLALKAGIDPKVLNYQYPEQVDLPPKPLAAQTVVTQYVRQQYMDTGSVMDQLIPSVRNTVEGAGIPEPKIYSPWMVHSKLVGTTGELMTYTEALARATAESAKTAPPTRSGLMKTMVHATEAAVEGLSITAQQTLVQATSGRIASKLPEPMIKAPTYIDWQILVKTAKFALSSSYRIVFFLAEPKHPNDATAWLTDPNMVGIFATFSSEITTTGCKNCEIKAEENLNVTGVVPLTGALLDRTAWHELKAADGSDTDSNDQAAVDEYLKKHLTWRLSVVSSGEIVDPGTLPSLKIGVMSREVTKPESIESPAVFGPPVAHLAATAGKPGGRDSSNLPEEQQA